MRIIFVRHGHPDYGNDCLTELGHKQAEVAAKRLSGENLHRIFSSPLGRAAETAEHIADAHGMKVEVCDFMREIHAGSINGEPILCNGQPWKVSDEMIAAGKSLMNDNWAKDEYFSNNEVVSHVEEKGREFDDLLSKFGYRREGHFYRVEKENDENVVVVSHGGSSSAVLSHIFNMPFPFVCTAFRPYFTAVTVAIFRGETGKLISPRFEIVNDMRHISDSGLDLIKEY